LRSQSPLHVAPLVVDGRIGLSEVPSSQEPTWWGWNPGGICTGYEKRRDTDGDVGRLVLD
jgi:hypothetical protein